jgi:hypothetical protein
MIKIGKAFSVLVALYQENLHRTGRFAQEGCVLIGTDAVCIDCDSRPGRAL